METAIVTIALSALMIVYLIVGPRAIRRMRAGDQEWRERWRSLDPHRRKAIVRTMRRGAPVRDPKDAELALRAVAQVDHVQGAMRPLLIAAKAGLLTLLAVGVVAGDAILVSITALGLALGLVSGVFARWRNRRLHRSAEATRDLTRS